MVIGAVGCSFSPVPVQQADPDADPVPDADPPRNYWVTAAVTRATSQLIQIYSFERSAPAIAPCAEQAAPGPVPSKALLPHPTLPFVYEVESGFHGLSLRCNGITVTGMENVGSTRSLQRIVLDADAGVGFFTIDGAGSIGLYRFTTATDGMPTVSGSGNATSQAGPLVLDRASSSLFVAGTGVVASHALVGPSMDLPAGGTSQAGCGVPTDLVVTGASVLEFCADGAEILRYTRNPFAFVAPVGTLGATAQVVALPGDRAIAARVSPPDLAMLALGGGAPTWSAGPSLPSRALAIAASLDGETLVSATQVDPTHSELATWRIVDHGILPLGTQIIDGTVTALAVTNPRP